MAEFKQLPNLAPRGAEMGFVEYHNLDVYAVFIAILSVILTILYMLLKFVAKIGLCAKRLLATKKDKIQ